MQVRTARPGGRDRVQTAFVVVDDLGDLVPEESLTKQSDVHRAEMKHILAKYEETGVLVGLRDTDLEFRDVSQFDDFSEMMRESVNAKQAFMRLPSKVREVFGHDHMNWLDAAHDGLQDDQRARLTKLGVLEEVEDLPPAPAPAPAAAPAAAPAPAPAPAAPAAPPAPPAPSP